MCHHFKFTILGRDMCNMHVHKHVYTHVHVQGFIQDFLLGGGFGVQRPPPWGQGDFLRSFYSTVEGAIYEAEICAILFVLRCSFIWYRFLAEVKIFRFWPKTMDYNKAFLPKTRRFSAVLLLHS